MSNAMLRYLEPVPFTIDNDAHLGLSETQGLLSCDGDYLIVEYRIADTVVGLVKTSSEEIVIPLTGVRSIRFEKRYLGLSSVIVLQAMNQSLLDDFGESRQGKVEMKIRRRDRANAETFCLEVGQAVLRLRNEVIARELDDIDRRELT